MLSTLKEFALGLSWSTIILIIVATYYTLRHGFPLVWDRITKAWAWVKGVARSGAAEAKSVENAIVADIAAIKADVAAVKTKLGA